MTTDGLDPKTFYTEQLPGQFRRALRDQERIAETAQRVLTGMQSVNTTLRIEVDGEGGGVFFLNIDAGRLEAGDAPTHPILLTLQQDRAGFDHLIRDAGDSALGFLGGLTGLASDMKLTQARVQALEGVSGCLRFEVEGDDGFSLLTQFGAEAVAGSPDTHIRVHPEVYAQLQGGQLDAQDAFMTGKIAVEGDMQLAMQVALAAMAPD